MSRPSGYLQKTFIQFEKVSRQSPRTARHQQETPRQSATVSESLPDRRCTCRRQLDDLRRCQNRLDTCRGLPHSQHQYHDRLGTCRRPPHCLRRYQIVF
ncbi:hypothetical protein DPMN_192374 [Dreissena polymorpha]|uniref:Uncharacterized protein n=1 Tax=Dreissena polymorpha TaxID=45954 RepID=A0A9D3Y3L2_DREPO|nr:hypothetical protein DPMN_192374 [Dreissena polymorpha]